MSSLGDTKAAANATRRTLPDRGIRLLAAGGAAGAAAACGGAIGSGSGKQASDSRLGPQGFAFKQPVALTYWKSLEGPRHEAQVKLTDDFNASRTDVKVTLEHVGVYAQAAEKLTAALAADTPPDVMLLTVDTYLPGAPAAIEGSLREVAMEGKAVRVVLEDLQRKLAALAQEAP